MKSAVRVALIGARGRMGQTILDLARNDPKIHIVAQCDLGDAIDSAMKGCDVAIDFTTAEAVRRNVEACVAAGVPLVEGTTGWNAEREEIEQLVRARSFGLSTLTPRCNIPQASAARVQLEMTMKGGPEDSNGSRDRLACSARGRVDVPLRLIVREINRWIRGERVEVGLARDRVAAGGPRSLSRLE